MNIVSSSLVGQIKRLTSYIWLVKLIKDTLTIYLFTHLFITYLQSGYIVKKEKWLL